MAVGREAGLHGGDDLIIGLRFDPGKDEASNLGIGVDLGGEAWPVCGAVGGLYIAVQRALNGAFNRPFKTGQITVDLGQSAPQPRDDLAGFGVFLVGHGHIPPGTTVAR